VSLRPWRRGADLLMSGSMLHPQRKAVGRRALATLLIAVTLWPDFRRL